MSENLEREDKYARARKRVKAKMEFLTHFFVYIIVIGFLYLINNMTYSGYQWWPWPAMGWGIGVAIHFVTSYLFIGGNIEERMIKREIDRMDD